MAELNAVVERQDQLPQTLREEMFELYFAYYEATARAMFFHDLEEKDWVIVLRDEDGKLRGFSTIALLETARDETPLRALFSGDTIIHHKYWGEHSLAFTWIHHAGRVKAQAPDIPLYWFLIVKGHRTYRLLQAFARRYYPHFKEPTPASEQSLMTELARMRFGDSYDPCKGILHFDRSRGQLRPAWAALKERETRRPEVRCFLERNPGYVHGDELVCLTELHANNLRPLARRIFLDGMTR